MNLDLENSTCLVTETITKPDKIDIEITNLRHFGVKMKIPSPFEKIRLLLSLFSSFACLDGFCEYKPLCQVRYPLIKKRFNLF